MGEMRGGWEGGPRERIYVHLQLIHITVRQKVTQHCQATMHPPNKQTNKRTNSRPFFASDKAVAQKRLPPRTQMWAAHDRGWRQSAVADLGVWWRVGSTSLHLPLFWFSLPLNCTGLTSGRRGTGAWAERRALSGWRCLSLLHTLPWRRRKSWPRTWHFSTSPLSSCGALGLRALASSTVEGGW